MRRIQLGGEMKLTRRQLRILINETIFAGGPTVDSPDKSVGVTVDMAKQNPPKYSKEYKRDKAISKADPRLADLMSGDETDKNMARVMADTLFGIPQKVELTPDEQEAQSLFDEFTYDLFPPAGQRYHDTEDGRLQRSYAPEIQQIRDAMKKRIEAALDKGIKSEGQLNVIAYQTPGYDNLRRHLMNLPPAEQGGATGLYGDRFPEEQLMLMPSQLIDMYKSYDSDIY